MLFRSSKIKRFWLGLTILGSIVIIKAFAHNNFHVEHYYSREIYHYYALLLRFLFGWIPFSLGDMLYLAAGIWGVFKITRNLMGLFKGKFTKAILYTKFAKLALWMGSIYIIFNLEWGLNYNRKGIAWQLQLQTTPYDTSDLKMIQGLLLDKVNQTKKVLVGKSSSYPSNKILFSRAEACYRKAASSLPFLSYQNLSVKSSFYGKLGDYLGFTGYYNPFTGEAQVNTTVPQFLRPYVTLHEMGHQLGYAKEDEANFSGYLAAANGKDTLFQYSAYLDLFVYANRELFYLDSTAARGYARQLIPPVVADLREWRRFNEAYTSKLEPAVNWIYGKYLEENQQPKGLRSYNAVVEMLIAYYKKFGKI